MNYVDIHNILYPLQRGFRKGLSCNAQLLEFIDYITKNIDEGIQTDRLMMDFFEGFDKVSYSFLVHMLHQGIIRGKQTDGLKLSSPTENNQ